MDFAIKEVSLDFSKMRTAAFGLWSKSSKLFSLSSNNAILEFLLEVSAFDFNNTLCRGGPNLIMCNSRRRWVQSILAMHMHWFPLTVASKIFKKLLSTEKGGGLFLDQFLVFYTCYDS